MSQKIVRENIIRFKPMCDTMNLEEALKEANRCLLCFDAPCSKGCPAGTDPGKFIRQIKFENLKGAARTIRNNNVLGYTCGYLCPAAETCQKACSIAALQDPIDIGGLQRFACDYAGKIGLEPLEIKENRREKVAVIGAGPAGMSCAFELAKAGYSVTIFEKEAQGGGIPRGSIPDYRIAQQAMEQDFNHLMSLGVSIQYKTEIKSRQEAEDLFKQGYKAVFVGVGLSDPVEVDFLRGNRNYLDYFQFLKKVKETQDQWDLHDQSVVVIGGGSVAMDVACSAAALGAKATVVYRRAKQQMPAYREEIDLAHHLGVNFRFNSIITGAEVEDDDRVTRLKGCEVEWFSGNPSPKILEDSVFHLSVDWVVPALGTLPSSFLTALFPGLAVQGKGLVRVKEDFSTNLPGVFSAGDVVNGGKTVAQAVGEGKKAAQSIDRFIRG